ncbi:Ig-like domain-containing protein [Ruminococcus bromii]|jgi:fibronectin type 3 domain-containing protein|uniref:Ig-like domain-containing protein n=2 Tax=Ruminococcus bromii TaxID=40518 RepID=UPI00242ABE4E|nr:Ig-like domain-containing protein [Ruminococcus bromii]
MKLKRILSSFLAVVMAFGVVSLATVDENGNIFGNTLTAEAATEKTATKMPDNAITFSSTYSDELEIIPAASKNGMYYYNNKVIYFYSVANNTFRKIYDYNDKGRNKDTVICVYADAEKGKFYIVWLDSSNRNKKYYYLDEFDVKSEKFVSTKDISSLVGSNNLSHPESIGVDSQNRYYLAVYDSNQDKYIINLISADMKLLSSAVAGDAVYKFSGFDKTNGNFYFEGYTDWIYWGYSHDTQSLKCGNVKNNKISISNYYVDILYQQYYTPHYDNAVMLTNGDFVWTSTMSGAVRVLDSAKFDIADKDSSLPLKLSVSRSGYEIEDRYADSIGTRTVYNAATGDYLMYVNDNTIAELDSEGNKKSTFKTAYPVFAMYNYGDSVLVIEKDTDENFYVENLKWAYPTKITLSKTSATIKVGESLSLKATSDSVLDISFTWSSNNNSVASVTKDGKVYGNKAGSATITVKSENGITAVCKVTVQNKANNPDSGEVKQNGASSNNISANDYYTWSSVVKSNLTENSDKTLTRVESTSKGVLVEKYSANGKTLISKSTIKNELPIYGGYFSGKNNNYIVFGQNNKGEKDSAEIVRIVKYSKSWSRVSDCKIYGSNTFEPFEAGSLRMIELDGKLYVYTCHTMYADSNKLNHQANMLFTVDESTMKTTDSMYEVSNLQDGYVSHSFNQFIKTDGTYIYRVDHSESNNMIMSGQYLTVNGITLSRYNKNSSSTNVAVTIPLKFDIHSGNYTGASIGGFEVGSGNCLIVYTKDISSSCKSRNAYISVTDEYFNKTNNVALTNYKSGTKVSCRTPQLVKINENLFLVMWEEYNSSTNKVTTKAKTVDSSANTVASATLSVRLSDCQPVMCSDGTVKWYVSDNSSPKLYSINPYDLTKRHEHTYTSVVTKQPTCKATGVRTYTCTTCGAKKTETINKLAHSYKQYVTPATTSADGSITKKCTACGYSSSKSKIYKITSVSLSSTVFTYSGNNITPSVTVKNSKNNKLVKGKDYKVIYPTNSVNVGRYSVKIQFIGNYSGTVNKYFDIVPTVSSLTNTTGGIKLSWNKVDGAYGYRIYQKTSNGWKRIKDTTATSYTDSAVSANQTKTYTIRCIDKKGKTVSGFYSKGWSKKYTPVAPTISKLENTSSGIKLNWNKITGVYGYRLYYKTSSGGWKRFKDTTATSFTDSGVSPNRTETYTIRCIDKNGNTISGFNSNGWSIKYVPVAPTISKLENTSSGIKLSWNKVTGVYGYRIYQKTSNGWKRIKDTTATSFTDSAVSANQTKTYTIRCIDKNGNTVSGYNSKGWSKKYTAATPKITKLTNTSKGVSVTWNKIAGVYGYRLYRKYDGGSWTKVKDTTSTSFTDSGAKKGKKVIYTVRCIDRKGKTVSGFNSKGWSITRK